MKPFISLAPYVGWQQYHFCEFAVVAGWTKALREPRRKMPTGLDIILGTGLHPFPARIPIHSSKIPYVTCAFMNGCT